MRRLVIIVLILNMAAVCQAQDPAVQQIVEDLLESAGETMSDETDFQEILDDLEGFRQQPLNLNMATKEELDRLHLLSPDQIENFLTYREKTGIIYSLYELASINGFDPDLLEKLEPFVGFRIPEESSKKKRADNTVLFRTTRVFSVSTDAEQAKCEGSAERFYVRMKHTSDAMNYGFVGEKDPGEAFFRKSQPQGFDYNSAFANFEVGKSGNRLFAGDYHVRFGQGLIISQGFSVGKSAETTQVFRANEGIRSYSSTDENQFFRGMAGRFQIKDITISPFVSWHRLDAHIDTIDGSPFFGAFQTSGYHRTGSELAGKHALTAIDAGAHVSYRYKSWSFGATSVFTRFNALLDRANEPYNQFLPEGQSNLTGGFDWKGSIRNIFWFGEAAFTRNSGRAFLSGTILKPAPNAELALVYRNINRTYYSFYSNAFVESSRINDEQGFYAGTKIFPAPHLVFWAYADFFRFSWMKYTTEAPSVGTEFFVQVSWSPTVKSSVYLRFFQEEKAQRQSNGLIRRNEQQKVNKIRLNFIHELNDRFSLKTRIEAIVFSRDSLEHGFLVLQDFSYKAAKKTFSANGRLAWFKTDSYNSRVYAYESDVLYAFSVPALYGNGFRAYLNLGWHPGKHLSFWAKVAQTFPVKNNSVSPESRSEAKFEALVRF